MLDAIKPSEINVQNIGYFKLTLLYSIGILTINPNDPRMTKPAIIGKCIFFLYWLYVVSKINCYNHLHFNHLSVLTPLLTLSCILVLLICMSIMVCGSYSLPTASAKPKVQDGGQTLFDSDQSLFTSDRSSKCNINDLWIQICICFNR